MNARDLVVDCLMCLLCLFLFCVVFFVQAEDGIRDLVRSRGLGDVYKRQPNCRMPFATPAVDTVILFGLIAIPSGDVMRSIDSVSYTHLTLPTSDLV